MKNPPSKKRITDRERLDWLESESVEATTGFYEGRRFGKVVTSLPNSYKVRYGEKPLRAAIDAAIRAARKK